MDDKLHEGNAFFRHRYPTIAVEHFVDRFKSFEDFEKFFTDDLMNENLLLGQYLSFLLDKYDMSPNKVALEIGKSHSYVRKITGGKELNPSRDVLLAICVRLGASFEETQTLLRYAGKAPLYARRKRDAIIWYAIKRKQNLYDLNVYLDSHGYASLCKIIVRNEK